MAFMSFLCIASFLSVILEISDVGIEWQSTNVRYWLGEVELIYKIFDEAGISDIGWKQPICHPYPSAIISIL